MPCAGNSSPCLRVSVFKAKVVSYLASVRKSILAMLYGNYVASGKVRLNQTLAEIGIDDLGG
jgi:CubicO group peptidase (beta-lactamase class C family)